MTNVIANNIFFDEDDYGWSGLVHGRKYTVECISESYITIYINELETKKFHRMFFGFSEQSFEHFKKNHKKLLEPQQ